MMRTRCPHCGTTFRIAPEQLKARQGRVRCGKCQGVFDAVATLMTAEPEQGTPPAAPAAAAVPAPAVPVAPTEAVLPPEAGAEQAIFEPLPEAEAPAEPEPAPEAAAPAEPEPNLDAEPEPEARIAEAEAWPEPVSNETPEPIEPVEPEAAESEPEPKPSPVIAPEPQLHEDESPGRARRWPWLLAGALALATLVAQALLHFRTEAILIAPETRPLFAAACDALGCELALPRKIDLIGIETSDLAPAKGRPGHLNLSATLRNRAPFAQAWPHLEITLTDAQDRAVLRRALAPGEYLPPTPSADDGFPGQSDRPVQLTLDVGDTPAIGYRLYIFYP